MEENITIGEKTRKRKFAFRTIRLCTKDCLCLYVCPTGATDTENSIIDVNKCVGCGACANACPSKAISMVPLDLPLPQEKTSSVVDAMNGMSASKTNTEQAARQLAGSAESDTLYRLMTAISRSSRLMAEDISREAGFMLPQGKNAHDVLEAMVANPPSADFPLDAAKQLLATMNFQTE